MYIFIIGKLEQYYTINYSDVYQQCDQKRVREMYCNLVEMVYNVKKEGGCYHDISKKFI